MAQFHRTLLLLLFVTKALSESGSTNASRKYELYHDLGDGFTPRNSVITLTASKDESSSYSILVEESSSTNNVGDINAVCEDGTCETQSPEEIAILELMKSGKFYKIKAIDVETGKETMTSVHPCSIRKSNFR